MKSQRKPWFILIAIFAIITIIFNSCGKEDEISTVLKKEKVTGYVQKGPYINGTQILMSELNASLEQTGNLFTTQITNNRGSFEINDIVLTSSFVEFSASGYFFDEVKGEITASPLSLFALADITDISTVNVNILTHLERRRVEYLVKQNTSFAQAKTIAQAEVLAMFGIEKENMQGSENLDIAVNNEDNAILLSISLILQGNRSVGDLTELLATISADIREDGILSNQAIIVSLRNSTLELDLESIRENLVARYNNLGVSASIPDFETYIETFLAFSGLEPVTNTLPAADVTVSSATLNGIVHPNSLHTVVTFEYGQTEDLGNSIVAEQSPLSGHTNQVVSAVIGELEPATTYYYRVKAENDLGITIGDLIEFWTMGLAPEAVTMPAENISTTNAMLKGIVNPRSLSTTVVFEYGTTEKSTRTMASAVSRTSKGFSLKVFNMTIDALQSPLNGESDQVVTADLSVLEPGVAYHFRVKAENELGVAYGEEMTFTTNGQAPMVNTLDATNIGLNEATLQATVNPNHLETAVSFEYGTTTEYGNIIEASTNPINGSNTLNVNASLTQLIPGTTYHYRIKAENQLGVTYGANKTFTTLGQTPTVIINTPTNIGIYGATLQGAINPNSLITNVLFEYGTSTDYGQFVSAPQSPLTGDQIQPVSVSLNNLNPGTQYHCRIKAENTLGVSYSEDMQFTTLGGLPIVQTTSATNLQTTIVTVSGTVNPNYFSTSVYFEYGLTSEYGSILIPEISPISGSQEVLVSMKLINLSPGTDYHYRMVAENSQGVTFGQDILFSTLSPINDVDGNVYNIVKIGTQYWMAENLRTTKYNDGTSIPLGMHNDEDWQNLTTPAYHWYGNDQENYGPIYGAFYNWYATNLVETEGKNICPVGWHVPSDDEWTVMEDYLSTNGYNYDGSFGGGGGKIAKALASTIIWNQSTTIGAPGNEDYPTIRNITGFSALPLGPSCYGYWWTSTSALTTLAWPRNIYCDSPGTIRGAAGKNNGFAVRCVKD